MTLEGTNTYVLRGTDGTGGVVVVDPGPLDEAHLARVASHGPVRLTLLTHGHLDHAEGARRFAELTGSPVAARDPGLCLGADAVAEGVGLTAPAGLGIEVLHTPGHTGD